MRQKIIILGITPFIILALCLSYSFTSSLLSPSSAAENNVKVDIALGRGPSCVGRGLCKVKDDNSLSDQDINTKGKLYFNTANKLTLDIDKKDIDVWTKDQQIVDDKFEIIDSYTITAEIMNQLGIPRSYTISPGEYEVNETDNSFVIEF